MGFGLRRITAEDVPARLRSAKIQPAPLPFDPGRDCKRSMHCATIAVILILDACLAISCRTGKTTVPSTGMEFVPIPAGKFMMGCSPGDNQCDFDESPSHQVEIAKSFEMGKYEVTQAQWSKVMGSNPSKFKVDDRLPVESVSWDDVQAFIARLNALKDGYRYRLPTEAEWEYAARAGSTGPRYADLDAIAWYEHNSGNESFPGGQKQPNSLGLYDMIGNVWEWCSDWYGPGYYSSSPQKDPQGPASGVHRVLRGGSRLSFALRARASFRYLLLPDIRSTVAGLRLCRERY